MSTTKNLLVELFVEELPPKVLKKLGEAFANALADSLKAQGLATVQSVVTPFASPRRLAVNVSDVVARAEDRQEYKRVMPVRVAFDPSGQLVPSARKKLASLGASPADEERFERAYQAKSIDSEYLHYQATAVGITLVEGLQKALDEALAKLPIPKVMQYQLADGWSSVHFVRPAHGLVALYGDDVVAVSTLGLNAGRSTHGHRFEASVDPIELKDADHYAQQLETQGAVIASFAARRDEIARQLNAAAANQRLKPINDDALLDEVTGLVERPNVLVCQFEAEFLAVPQECLILTMKANQKYFPLLDAAGKLTNKFLVVSNIRPEDPSRVIEGNERVVRPRLADAKFFFGQDRKKTLESRVPGLDKVVYHGKLGTQGERGQRVRAIARAIGQQLGGEALAKAADRAAMLAKADLVTDMVGEFPELQGTMGGYYARHDGESDEVAIAIEDHYKPRFAGDELPRNLVGVVVALADKFETLVGLFAIDQKPTGDKDPFALRRHALGVCRLLIERNLDLELGQLIRFGRVEFENFAVGLPSESAEAIAFNLGFQGTEFNGNLDVFNFVCDRLAGYLRDLGSSAQEVGAVLSLSPQRLSEVPKFLAATRAFAALPEAASLAAVNKRVGNILKKVEGKVVAQVDRTLMSEATEIALYEALAVVRPVADAAFERGDYTASLQALAALRKPVDAFFESVMVNAEDPALRANRLGLLAQLHAAMNRVADLSKLAT